MRPVRGNKPDSREVGRTEIPRWEWQHVVFVRDGRKVRAYLNGKLDLETEAPADYPAGFEQCFFGGRSDHDSSWEGRIDEIAVFNRALSAAEVGKLQPK